MNILKKKLALALTLALCVMPLSASLALAETDADLNASVANLETTPVVESEVSEPASDPEATTDPAVTEETKGNTEPENTTETVAGEVPDGSENAEEELPPILDENGEVVSPGTLPDSPVYWLTTLIEKLQVALTFDPVKKTELLEEQALERIAEAGALIEQGDTEEAEGAITAYTEKIAEAQAFLALLTETDSETTEKLETALSKTHANNIQTLGGLLEKLPPQAAQKVALNVVRSMEKSITKMDKKDQQKVAKELRKAAKGLEDSELSEEDQAALENLDQTLEVEDDQSEELEDLAVASGETLNTMALTTSALPDADAEKSKVLKVKSEAKAELKSTKQQEQKLESKDESESLAKEELEVELKDVPEDEAKDEAKAQEQKVKEQKEQQDSKLKADQESASKEKDASLDNASKKPEERKLKRRLRKNVTKKINQGVRKDRRIVEKADKLHKTQPWVQISILVFEPGVLLS
ncbi:MAG: DUF5667 domain-containing protein [Desulfosporosinus sp.]|nr:DUF5667 domain-containing protein [Desulfosporosinus sp.]